ncbi:MAG: hypothetical protein ABIJ57_11550, partial [Pseudomonadota bacterium]
AFEEFQTLRVLCKNNLALHYKFGSLYGARILRDDYRTVEISGTVLLSGQTQKSAVTTLAKQRLTVNMQRALTSNYIMIDIPAMTYTVYPRQIVSPGLLSVDFRGVGKLDATSQYQIQFTCVNTKSAYF